MHNNIPPKIGIMLREWYEDTVRLIYIVNAMLIVVITLFNDVLKTKDRLYNFNYNILNNKVCLNFSNCLHDYFPCKKIINLPHT